ATDGEDGPLQLGRDVPGDVVVGPGQVVQALGSGLQVASPPLLEPGLGAAQRRADLLDGPAGEAETDGALTRREFVVHGALRGAAAGGCPRRTFSIQQGTRSGGERWGSEPVPPPIATRRCRTGTREALRCVVGKNSTMRCRSAAFLIAGSLSVVLGYKARIG